MDIRPDWLSQVQEDIVDPDRKIIDAHHHLWRPDGSVPYSLTELDEDTNSGHRVEQTVFMECHAAYRKEGPPEYRSLGEVEFVAEEAKRQTNKNSKIAALISHVDLTLGEKSEAIIESHAEASNGLFRGVRHAGARSETGAGLVMSGDAPEGLFSDEKFRQGVKILGKLGHVYESWHYHYQLADFIALANAVPDTQIVLNHFGSPIITGIYYDQREAIIERWQQDIIELAKCDNVTAKLGGLALSVGGTTWRKREQPPTSDEFAERQHPFFLHTIEAFGPDRCMFESNFPVDKMVISYPVLWNAYKKMVQHFAEDEKDAMFAGTASRVYRI